MPPWCSLVAGMADSTTTGWPQPIRVAAVMRDIADKIVRIDVSPEKKVKEGRSERIGPRTEG